MHPYTRDVFAQSVHHIGEPVFVPTWNTYVLKRPILMDGNIVGHDAIGLYPITILSPTTDIESGLEFLRHIELVSVVIVLDDFHRPPMNGLINSFHLCKKLKTHYIFDPNKMPIIYNKHHRYELRQAHKMVRVEQINLSLYMDEWVALYGFLSNRHNLKGYHDFPPEHFKVLSEMENVISFGAFINDQLVSCHIWVEYDGLAHSHLAASNEQGYMSSAAYALNDFALHHFNNCSIVNFGGGAGLTDEKNGLSKFKKGFSNREADAIICGEILDKTRYDEITMLNGGLFETNFFPAYRTPRNGSLK